ncbi:MAG: hypothetical protein ACSLE9_07750 [Burkholderiaceae bacterium]
MPITHEIISATCDTCGADDCRYDTIDAACPDGRAWIITRAPGPAHGPGCCIGTCEPQGKGIA